MRIGSRTSLALLITILIVVFITVRPSPARQANNGNFNPMPVVTSLSAVSTGNGTALDNGTPRNNHTIQVIGSSGISLGAAQLQGSLDGTNWVLIGTPVTAVASLSATGNATGSFRYIRASVTTTITGGTVTCIVASS